MDGWTGPTTFDATEKYEELDRNENIVLSNGNDAPTLFRNLHSPSMLLTMLHGKATRIITWQTPSIGILLSALLPPHGCTEQSLEPTPVSGA